MSTKDTVIVGTKGEILPKKKLREKAGIFPGDQVIIMASPNEFIIKKVLTVDDAFNLPIIDSSTPEEIEKQIKEEIKNAQIGDSLIENR
ncbi:MAG: hypothetical protein ACTSRK_12055 [Promethearchaeota archaeon]